MMQSDKDIIKEQDSFDQAVDLIREGKNDEAKSILQNTNLHQKTSTPDNLTLLHIAAETGNTEMTGHLICLGSDIEAKTASGITPLTLSIEKKHESIVQILIFHGKCNTSYIDAIAKLPTIDDIKSVEWRIFHNIFMKQQSDWLSSSEGQSFINHLKSIWA